MNYLKVSSIFPMRKFLLLFALLALGCGAPEKPAGPPIGEVNIIPQPFEIKRIGGEFELTKETTLVATDEGGILGANAINDVLSVSYGLTLNISGVNGPTNSIVLIPRPQPEGQSVKDESYELKVEPNGVQITGTESGLFYGVQTLIQMIPNDVNNGIRIPAAVITDAPRFRYRGFHLDEARHFMGADFVKKYIALAARYKLNYFHWHLTDDQGWRIAIEKYPLLTEVGSTRPESVRAEAYLKKQPYAGDGKPVEGFYTREQITDIVAYAKARSVTIIPEIEMPGHSSAALAAYPQYGCTPTANYKVKRTWGNPPDGFPEILCPSEETITFLTDVLDEVMDMFPDSPYIHVGGDETNMSQWRLSPVVQAIKTREGFTDEYQVLKWFVDRIGSHVESRGKKIICWDDMIEKGQIPNATIMSWKGPETARVAALANREVIITPYERLYFDHPQSGAAEEAKSFGPVVTLKSVFNFSVVPPQPTPEERRNIIGGEGCVWTEFIETPDRAEYMAFPRLIALADGLWSGNSGKDFRGFITNRLFNEFARLDRLPDETKLNYRIPEPFDLADHVVTRDTPAAIELLLPIPGSRVYFTTDGSIPNTTSSGYAGRFIPVPPGFEGTIKAIVKQTNGRPSSVFEVIYSRGAPNVRRIMPPPLPPSPMSKSVNNDVEVVSRAEPITRPSPSPVAKPRNGNTEKKPSGNNQQ